MNLPTIDIKLDEGRRSFRAGEILSGQYTIVPAEGQPLRAVELSVLWYTEGKGEEDLGVHFFERLGGRDATLNGETRRFETRLPLAPLSYEGSIIKIRWCVRVRVFLSRSREYFVESPFQLSALTEPHPQPAIA